jgi:hypothetical protein
MKMYLKRLSVHPGVPFASIMTILFLLAGSHSKSGLIAGTVVAAIMWLVVLWTARTQPLPKGTEDMP